MNKAPFYNLNVRWLIDPASNDLTPTVVPPCTGLQRQDFNFPPEIGHGWFEHLPLTDRISVFHGVHHFRPEASGQLLPLGEFSTVFAEPTLVMQSVQGGIVCHRERYPVSTDLIYKPGFDFFRHADRFSMTALVDTSSDSQMTSLCIDIASLSELIGADLAQQLLVGLGLDAPPVVKVLPIPLHVSAPLRACISPVFQGVLKKVFAQSKVLEYLCQLSAYIGMRALVIPQAKPGSKRSRVHELHDWLLKQDGKVPTLDEMAVRFGMSARWLNDEFTLEYGQTIYAFITDRRLTSAHVALRECDVPIKNLAQRLGYSHVSHFTTAFKKKFGYPPGSLRRK